MVYGVIDTKSRRSYTSLKDVFDAIDNRQNDYNWLITDSEIVARTPELEALHTNVYWQYENGRPIAIPAPEYHFLSGEELTGIVERDDSQWIWGVLSGFDKTIPLETILQYPLPEANGNGGFWKDPPSLQHELASIEIVPFDSSCVLLFSKDKEIVDRFKRTFPECQDIREYNAGVSDAE